MLLQILFLFIGLTLSYAYFKYLNYVIEVKEYTLNDCLNKLLTTAYIDVLIVIFLYFNFVYFTSPGIMHDTYKLFLSYLLGKYAFLATRNFKTDLGK